MTFYARKYFNILVLFASILFLFCSFYFYTYIEKQPYIGVFTEQKEERWIVRRVDPSGIAHRWGINPGDMILTVDGTEPGKHYNVWKWGLLENANVVSFQTSEGGFRQFTVDDSNAGASLSEMVSFVALSSAFLGIGIYTYYRKSRLRLVREFLLLNTTIAFSILAAIPSSHGLLSARVIEILSVTWVPYFLVSFFQQFPVKIGMPFSNKISQWFRWLGFLFSLTLSVYLLVDAASSLMVNWFRYGLIIQVGLSIVAVVFMFKSSLQRFKPEERSQFLVLICGVCLGFLPFLLLSVVPQLIAGAMGVPFQYTLLGTTVLPLTFSYVLVKRQVMDIRFYFPHVLINFTYYSFILVLVLTLHFFLTKYPGKLYLWVSLFLAVFIGLNFVRKKVVMWGYKHFFEKKDELKRLKIQLLMQLTQGEQVTKTMRLLLELIHRVMDVEGVFVVWCRKTGPVLCGTGCFENKEKEIQRWLEDKYRNSFDRERPTFGNLINEVYVMEAGEEPLGYLIVGNKKNGTQFTNQETDWLKDIKEEMLQIFIHSSRYEELRSEYRNAGLFLSENGLASHRDLNRLLIEAQEEEKNRLAQFLHDHILQNLIFLSRDLEELRGDRPFSGGQARIDFLIGKMHDTIYEIRELCVELYPSMIEDIGLKEALHWLVREVKEKRNVLVGWRYGLKDESLLSFALKVTLFRIIKELITNALKHAQPSHIQLSLLSQGDTVLCEIVDDGKGFHVPDDFKEFLNGKHLGLVTVQKRIEYFGGELSIYSTPGKGTRIVFHVPLSSKEWEHERTN